MKQAPISLLMSVYYKEQPEYFEATMESVLKQTLQPSEIILIRDGELTEALDTLIEKYQTILGDRLQVYSFKVNVGLGEALAKGVTLAKNELIARMDTDDIMIPERLEKQYSLFEKNSDLTILGSDIIEFSGSTANIQGKRVVPKTDAEIRQFAKKRNPFNHMTVMYKKQAVLDAGNYLPLTGFEDYYLWVRLIKNGAICQNISEALVFARAGEDMHNRRGGSAYLINGLKGRYKIYRVGKGSLGSLAVSSSVHIVMCVMPTKVRGYLYNKFLRK